MRLEVAQTARVDFELTVGTATEVVEVSVAMTLMQSEKTEVGQVIDNKRILEMPLNGRNYLELAQLSVGVIPARQLGKGHRTGEEGGFIAVGQHAYQNNIMLDGNDNSARGSGVMSFQAQAVKPPVDAVAEFKVITNNASAEHGYGTGGKVLVSTKNGTNEFHGSAYEFLRNDALDGTNFFANRAGAETPPFRQNQFGGTIGGPIVKNKVFFFTSYQGTRIRLGQSFTSGVPSRAVVGGDFSEQPTQRRNVFDPLTIRGSGADAIRDPFPNNRIPASRFDPVAKQVVDLYPAPNVSGRANLPANFFRSAARADDNDQYDFRWDYNANDFHRMFIRYSIRDQLIDNPGPLPAPAFGGCCQLEPIIGHNIAMNFNSTLSPTMHNEFRFGWTDFDDSWVGPFDEDFNQKFGIKGAPSDGLDEPRFALFIPQGFSQVGGRNFVPNLTGIDNLLIGDTLLIQKGKHSLRVGGEFRRTNFFRNATRFRDGQMQFNGVYTAEQPNVGSSRAKSGNSMADFLLGWSNNFRFGDPRGENMIYPYYGFFVQDDWKLNPKLTLNLGLRWDFYQNPYFPNPAEQTVTRYLDPIFHGVPEEQFIVPEDGRDCGCEQDLNNFGPRLGIAYRLSDQTVIRAGVGIYYGGGEVPAFDTSRFRPGAPLTNEVALPQPREMTSLFVQEGFPVLPRGEVAFGVSVNVDEDFKPTTYSSQWFFDIQHSLPGDTLVTLAYNGSSTSSIFNFRNINAPFTPHPTIRWQARKIRPQFNAVNLHENAVHANYNSWTVKAERRFAQGLTFLSSFTWAHNIDNGNEFLNGASSGAASPYDISRERASADLDRRLGYVLSFVYELPFGKGKPWLQSGPASWILGDWQIGGILSLLSGMPWDHQFNVDNQNNAGRVRGDALKDPNLPGSQRTIDRWFDTSFLVASAPGMIGNAGRNLIAGPGRSNYDLIIAKNFFMPWEGHRLQFRFESFNFTNTPHFGNLNTRVGTPAGGRINAAEDPRRIQFGLKYVF